MGIGDHPQRTPLYGAVILIGVMVAATAVSMIAIPTGIRVAVYALAAVSAIIGVALTLRDLS